MHNALVLAQKYVDVTFARTKDMTACFVAQKQIVMQHSAIPLP